jgi:HPt (histidine-containing phosphotransfer) domain-containing protein
MLESTAVEKEIRSKAKEWVDEYGADFLVELIDVYLADTPNRLALLRQAIEGGDAETCVREAHTLKSSSANLGALELSASAKEMEAAGRAGRTATLADEIGRFESQFAAVKTALEALRGAPEILIQEN